MGVERLIQDDVVAHTSHETHTCVDKWDVEDENMAMKAEERLRACLARVRDDTTVLILHSGYDANGTCHTSESVYMSRLPPLSESDEASVDASSPPPPPPSSVSPPSTAASRVSFGAILDAVITDVDFLLLRRAWRRWLHQPDNTTMPAWISRALATVSANVTPTTHFLFGTECLVVVDGVLPPHILSALSRTTLPTRDGTGALVTRTSTNIIHVAGYLVDLASWVPETHTYQCVVSTDDGVSTPSIRTVHRRRLTERNRR